MIKPHKRKQIDTKLLEKLQKETDLNKEVLEILLERDIDTIAKIKAFFDDSIENLTSPYVIKDMSMAVEFVVNAVKNKKKILIYGDYDCDGITSIALMKKYFESIGYSVDYYLPDRELEGYGLSKTSIDNFMNLYSPDVVITVDCGISNYNEIDYLKSLGVEILVTDHHEIPERLPNCIIINPKTDENNLHNLAGVGVASKLVEALSDREFVTKYFDLVAIGTIADLVDLTGDNRIIVKYGLRLINQNKILGLTMLLRNSKKINSVSEGDIAFTIAPQLNSVGRMENANKVVELFFSTDTFFLNSMIDKLEKLNSERKFLCDEIYNQALLKLKNYDLTANKVIVLYDNKWKNGVLGIVASRIVEQFNLPTVLFGNGDDEIKGSARSVKGINLFNMLNEFKMNFISFGGHESAAGLKINKNYLDNLRQDLSDYIKLNNLTENLFPQPIYDVEIKDINAKLFEEIDKLSPFGMGNPIPKFLINNNKEFKIFSSKHIKYEANEGEIIAFNQCENINNYNNSSLLIVKLSKNTFNGYTKYQGLVQQCYSLGKVNDEKDFFLDYIKSLLYPTKNVDVEYIENYSESLDNADDLFGTIFVTYSGKCFYYLFNIVLSLPKYKNKFFIADIKNRSSATPYNRVVLSPSKNYDFSGYNNIVFVETPMNMVYYNNIHKAKIIEDEIAFKREIKELRIDRDFLIEIFKKLKLALTNKVKPKNIDEFYNIVKNEYELDCTFIEFAVAFYIFYELEFLSVQDGFIIVFNKNIKKPLEQSKIFNEIMELKKN